MDPVRLVKKLAFPVVAILILFGTHSSVFSYAALALSAVYVIMVGEDEALYLLVFILNMANIFRPSVNNTSFYTYLVILYVARLLIRKLRFPSLIFLFALYLVIIQLVTSNVDVQKSVKLIVYMLMLTYVMNNKKSFDMDRILAFYAVGVLMASVVALLDSDFFRISALSLTKQLGRSYGFGQVYRFSGLDTDPNYYSVGVIISMCIVVLFYHRKKLNAFFTLALLAGYYPFVIMTYSKSAFLMSALPILYLFYGSVRTKQTGMQAFIGVLVGVFLFSLLTGRVSFTEIVLARFSRGSEGIGSMTTGRSSTWLYYLDYFRLHPLALLFGTGVNAPFARSHVAHNTYLENLQTVGVVGGTLFLAALTTPHSATKVKKNLLNYSVGVCVLLMYFFLSEMFYYDSVFHLLIAKIVFDMEFDFSGAAAPKKLIIGDASSRAAKNPFGKRAAEPVTAVERGH